MGIVRLLNKMNRLILIVFVSVLSLKAAAESVDSILPVLVDSIVSPRMAIDSIAFADSAVQFDAAQKDFDFDSATIYDFPYSKSFSRPNWNRLWVNTGVLMGAGVATMVVLEALPEGATAWNKAENQSTPLFERWADHVKSGPVWDKDNHLFNYVLHPYAGAVYYMSARSCGFNCWGSFLYCFCVSTFFWEYGFEAFNEIPSVQDLVITPVAGLILGEAFYLAKRKIVENGYTLLGSKVLGYAAAWLVDPFNETIGYFYGDQRKASRRADSRKGLTGSSWILPSADGLQCGFSLTYTF